MSLYVDGDRANKIEGPIETTSSTHTFMASSADIKFGTEYAVGVIAQTQGTQEDSNEGFKSIKTENFILSSPMGVTAIATTDE
ncbi:MAG: hypothetical protein ACNYNY_00730 [Candidatus Oxydemutatoraceae bacterium WSBS_2016_MAG_OTU14]